MTDVFPRRNLPEDAEPWGRAHDDRVIALEDGITRLGQSLQGQNRNSASSIQTLAEQVKDLVGRVGYSASTPGFSQTWTTPTTTPYVWGPSLTFTLSQARVVSIQTSVTGVASVSATNASTSAFAMLRGAIFVSGSVVSGSRGEVSTNVGVYANTGRGNYSGGSVISRSLISLTAGTYTVQGGFFLRNAELIGSPASGSASVTASDPSIFVDVLQPA